MLRNTSALTELLTRYAPRQNLPGRQHWLERRCLPSCHISTAAGAVPALGFITSGTPGILQSWGARLQTAWAQQDLLGFDSRLSSSSLSKWDRARTCWQCLCHAAGEGMLSKTTCSTRTAAAGLLSSLWLDTEAHKPCSCSGNVNPAPPLLSPALSSPWSHTPSPLLLLLPSCFSPLSLNRGGVCFQRGSGMCPQ